VVRPAARLKDPTIDWYQQIVAACPKHGAVCNPIRATIAAAYQLFDAPGYLPTAPSSCGFGPVEGDALRALYADPAADALKAAICEAQPYGQGAWCNYCDISIADSYDHYLAQSLFPEFAVNHANLVPACSQCNRHKHQKGHAVCVYLYSPPQGFERRWLFAKFDNAIKPRIAFYLDFAQLTDKVLVKQIQKHVKRLKLIKRYAKAASASASEILAQLKTQPQKRVAQNLLSQAASLSQIRGPNYWQVALFEAIARFLQSLPGHYAGGSRKRGARKATT
jgi:hypothetical protein